MRIFAVIYVTKIDTDKYFIARIVACLGCVIVRECKGRERAVVSWSGGWGDVLWMKRILHGGAYLLGVDAMAGQIVVSHAGWVCVVKEVLDKGECMLTGGR